MDFPAGAGDNDGMVRSRLWLWALLVAAMVAGGWYFGVRAQKNDRELPVYVTGGERLQHGEEIYRRSAGDGFAADPKPFTYPPFAAVPFVPFAWLPPTWQPPAWFALNFLILVALLRWLHGWAGREAPDRGPPRRVAFWVVTGLLGAHHVLSVFSNQSHDLFIAGAVGLAAAAWCRGRATAGWWVGVGAAVKATPLLFLGLFLVRRRWLALGLLVGAVLALSLLPDWWFPRSDGRWWLQAWYERNLGGLSVGATATAEGAWSSHSYLNQSLPGTLTRLLQPAPDPNGSFVDAGVLLTALPAGLFRAVALAAQLLVLVALALGAWWGGRAVRTAADPVAAQRTLGLGEVAAFVCGMVLLSPQSSKAHFCVWLFPAAFLADRVLRGRFDVRLLLLVGLAILVGTFGAKDLVGTRLGNRLLAYGNVTWCTVLLLLATVLALRPTAAPPRSAWP